MIAATSGRETSLKITVPFLRRFFARHLRG
jgi:hypothetical protein